MNKFIVAVLTAFAVLTTALPAAALNSDCPNRVVAFHNNSPYTLKSLQLRGRDSTVWSGNYLESFDVYPGQSVTVDGDYAPGSLAGYHVFVFHVTTYEGPSWTDAIDMCVVVDWYLWG